MATSRRPALRGSAIKMEDQNAPASGLGATSTAMKRTTHTSKEISVLADKKTSVGKAAALAVTNNPRKRILNDRTNAVKSRTSQSSLLDVGGDPKKPTLVRKASKLQVQEDEPDRPIKVIRKAPSSTNASTTASSVTVVKKGLTTIRGHAVKSTLAEKRTSRRLAGRPVHSVGGKSGVEEDEEAAEVAPQREAKRFKTSSNSGDAVDTAIFCSDDEDEIVKTAVVAKVTLKEGEEGWQDLDDGDENDLLMVKEYVGVVYEYMKELELKTLPDGQYMSRQTELTWKMRGILTDWLVEVHTKFRLLPETIFLATNLVDRFLSMRSVSLVKFQLVGITALFVAAKYEEVVCPSVNNFLFMTDGGYEVLEILKAEKYMLQMLGWDLSYPNPLNFLRRISKADGYDIQSRTFAKYFMEISVVDHRLIATQPSMIAAAGTWLARKVLERGEWDANLVHYSGYSERECLPTAQLMLDYVLRSYEIYHMGEPEVAEHGNFHKKYASKKFYRASEVVRSWAAGQYIWTTDVGREVRPLEEWEILDEPFPSP